MKRFLMSLFMTLGSVACHAEIHRVNDMKEVFDYLCDADSKTWAIFDVDMVLVQPSDPAFQMANMKRYGAICKRILQEVPPEKQMVFLSLMTVGSEPVLIDDRITQLLGQISHQGIPSMALTANLTGSFGEIPSMEEWRVGCLRGLGIDFAKCSPYQASLVLNDLAAYRGNYSTYHEGILFVNGKMSSKGEAFLSFLEKSGLSPPDKIIFVDDREDNLQSLEAAIQQLEKPIEYRGLHFLGAQKYPSPLISEEEFTSRWQKLAAQAEEFSDDK